MGAAALALLAAILLPMAMDQEPQTSSQDIQISIPDRDAMSSEARPIGPVTPNAPAADADITPAPIEQPAAIVSPPVPAVKPEAKPEVSERKPSSSVADKPASPPDDEAARVKALLSGGDVRATSAPAQIEPVVIQIGAFSDDDKAKSLAAELKKKGYAAYTEKAGAVTRVRVGPAKGRVEADKVAAQLRAQGLNAVIAPR
ncbi:SPOR domain-containing protein [Azoarcus sp. L1K30]|uniref:SPOR domain-containing protein n=1 Tax=Azoarcus sp. L1K30 TaxID=2820277 RepID=UPI0032C23509